MRVSHKKWTECISGVHRLIGAEWNAEDEVLGAGVRTGCEGRGHREDKK